MQLRFLLDTNIVIPAEPTSREDVEEATPVVAELLATLARGKHSWLIHPGTYDDVERDMVRSDAASVARFSVSTKSWHVRRR
ncbi:MAG TPA: hypothetical protein VER33_15715 [Polyangiaceae bacterium]|nr:hypothetical protein [Polyangiaceae bacterium]